MHWGSLTEIARAVREIPSDDIAPAVFPYGLDRDPDAARKDAREPERDRERERLRALADNIRASGVVGPLLVRKSGKAGERPYVLVAGEQRLAAARLAGRKTVPCVPLDGEDPEAAVPAVVENIHREDLNLFESAAAISALLSLTGLTQEQCARRLGVSQSYVANKLRLLRLTPEERRLMLENRLTERHGRALLRFGTPEERAPVLAAMIGRQMNVASAEDYVESLLCADARAARRDPGDRSGDPSRDRMRMFQKDTRRFTDTIYKAVDVIRRSGIPVESNRKDTPSGTLISILVPKSS